MRMFINQQVSDQPSALANKSLKRKQLDFKFLCCCSCSLVICELLKEELFIKNNVEI